MSQKPKECAVCFDTITITPANDGSIYCCNCGVGPLCDDCYVMPDYDPYCWECWEMLLVEREKHT